MKKVKMMIVNSEVELIGQPSRVPHEEYVATPSFTNSMKAQIQQLVVANQRMQEQMRMLHKEMKIFLLKPSQAPQMWESTPQEHP